MRASVSGRRAAGVLACGVLALAAIGQVSAQEALRATTPAPGIVVPSEPADMELESTLHGNQVRLSSLRSRVVVLFYEDREHIPQNEELKGTLLRFIADNHLEQRLMIQPVANADGFHYPPVDALVRGGLGEVARRIGMDILIDWDRRMHAAPFELRNGASCVVVLDRQGRILFRHLGLVGDAERTSLFRVIRQALRAS